MATEISNTSDVIDSRDVIERIAELDADYEAGTLPGEGNDERIALIALAEEASQYAEDWQYGETLIHDSYFEEYAQQLAEDIGAIDRDAAWPLSYIDWGAAADALRQDYTSVDFDGITYWVR